MKFTKAIFLFPVVSIYILSCSDNNKISEDGFHKAFIEILNGAKNRPDYTGAMVDVEKGVVVKICFENECVNNFDFWQQYDHSQTVYSKSPDSTIYTVYVIPNDWDQATEEQEKAKENNNNKTNDN
jgi:hypothetical protein